MATTDTNLQQLVINVGTKAQIDAAIAGGTITQDMLSVTTDGDTYIQGVQINGTDLTPDANNKVNIPYATNNDLGVVRGNQSFGSYMSNGTICTWKASDSELVAKIQNYKPIVPANLDVAIREGLGNNSLTWTEAYKTSARNTIGAGAKTIIREWVG